MSALDTLDAHAILADAGADPHAAEGRLDWSLAQLDDAVAELMTAARAAHALANACMAVDSYTTRRKVAAMARATEPSLRAAIARFGGTGTLTP